MKNDEKEQGEIDAVKRVRIRNLRVIFLAAAAAGAVATGAVAAGAVAVAVAVAGAGGAVAVTTIAFLEIKIRNDTGKRNRSKRMLSNLKARMPSKVSLADSLLLFVCKPDDAEAAVGDLLEELDKVAKRHGEIYCNFWFSWELFCLFISKARTRLVNLMFGPLLKKFTKG